MFNFIVGVALGAVFAPAITQIAGFVWKKILEKISPKK